MIKIIAKNYVKVGKTDEFKKMAMELVAKSQAEDGCVYYNLHEKIGEPNTLTFIECWESQEIIDKHGKTEHFTRIVPQLGEMCEKPGEVELYKVII
jgi:quinol monooxygenase YgiN